MIEFCFNEIFLYSLFPIKTENECTNDEYGNNGKSLFDSTVLFNCNHQGVGTPST